MQSSMSGDSTNPANYTASSHRTSHHDEYHSGHLCSYSGRPRDHDHDTHCHSMTTFNQTALTAGPSTIQAPTSSSSVDEIKAWVQRQLDMLGDTPLLNRFVMIGPRERRTGGAHLL